MAFIGWLGYEDPEVCGYGALGQIQSPPALWDIHEVPVHGMAA